MQRPLTALSEDQNTVFVLLSEDCLKDDLRTRFELAHEAIHCLGPSNPHVCRRIEEGVAVRFSLSASGLPDEYVKDCEAHTPDFYREALSDVRELERIEPNAISLLRSSQPLFRDFTPELLQRVAHAPAALAEALCREC